jgi:hypothetical protein
MFDVISATSRRRPTLKIIRTFAARASVALAVALAIANFGFQRALES